MQILARTAPSGADVVDYDRANLALYAELLDADCAGMDQAEVIAKVLNLDPNSDDAQECWRSHLDRARWIIGDGLGAALKAFGSRSLESNH